MPDSVALASPGGDGVGKDVSRRVETLTSDIRHSNGYWGNGMQCIAMCKSDMYQYVHMFVSSCVWALRV